jgi:hypothetical protein
MKPWITKKCRNAAINFKRLSFAFIGIEVIAKKLNVSPPCKKLIQVGLWNIYSTV